MTTEPSTDRDREGRRQFRAADDVLQLDLDDLVADASSETEEEPAHRSVTRFILAVAVCVVTVILLALVALQGLGTAFAEATGQSECTVPGCVAVPLANIEAVTGVDFPDGTSVERSVRSKGFNGDRMLRFEVRVPAGAPVPDAPRVLGNPQPWVSEPDPDNKPSRRAKDYEARGLQDVRWTFGGWAAGVEANGDSIVYGSDRVLG